MKHSFSLLTSIKSPKPERRLKYAFTKIFLVHLFILCLSKILEVMSDLALSGHYEFEVVKIAYRFILDFHYPVFSFGYHVNICDKEIVIAF